MKNETISRSYALALLEISNESKIDVKLDLDKVWTLIRESSEFEALLFMDVFSIEERKSVLASVFEKVELESLTKNFILFLIENKRFSLFPSIYTRLTMEKDLADGFITGVVEGSEEDPDNEVIEKLKTHIEKELKQIAKLEYKQNSQITTGYKITCGDLQLDATLENQFDRLRKDILAN
jgi:F-type H+-transporting ATPase subunit delta